VPRDGVRWAFVDAPPGRLYEGPQWVPEVGVFQWVDILAGSLHRWDPYGAEPAMSRPTGLEFATVALPLDADRVLVASRSSLHVYSWDADALETVGEWDFPPDVRFNDGALSPGGDIYVGTMSMDRRREGAALHRFDLATSQLKPVLTGIGISNGLCWDSPTTAYYIDSLIPRVDRLEVVEGQLRRSEWARLSGDDEPDGMGLAPNGTLVVALWGGGRLVSLDLTTREARSVSVPTRFPTSVAFGGRDREFTLVTSAADDAAGGAPGRVLVSLTRELPLRGTA